MSLGQLSFCLQYAEQYPVSPVGGIFASISSRFAPYAHTPLLKLVDQVRSGRNTYVAHQEKPLVDKAQARMELRVWASVCPGSFLSINRS